MFYLASALDPAGGLVLDVQDERDETSAVVQLYARKPDNGQNNLRNQLWQPEGEYIASALGKNLVLDVTDLSTSPDTHIQLWTQNPLPAPNQRWLQIQANPPYFRLESQLGNNLVLTARGAGQRIVTDFRTDALNQLWMWIPA